MSMFLFSSIIKILKVSKTLSKMILELSPPYHYLYSSTHLAPVKHDKIIMSSTISKNISVIIPITPSWKSATLEYLSDLFLTTVSAVTPLAVGFMLISYIHKHYNNDSDSIPKEAKAIITKILQKWKLDPNVLQLTEHEWTIAKNLSPPDFLSEMTWTDFAGSEAEIHKLKNLVVFPVKSRINSEEKCKNSKSLLQTPKGVLLHGPPGVGKTLLAKILAKESGCKLLTIDASRFVHRLVGESEKLTAAIFTLAEKLEPCIIFIDEIDTVFKSRASIDHSNSTIKGIFLSYWETLNQNKTVLVLGTTNRPKDIDPGFLRRFDLNLELSLPDFEQRKSILSLLLQDNLLFANTNEELLCLDEISYDLSGFSGADIKEVCRQVVILAMEESLKDGQTLTLRKSHFQRVIAECKKDRSSCGGIGGLDEYEMKIVGSLLAPDQLDVEWEDVAGLDFIIERLQKNVIIPLMASRNKEIHQSSLIQPPKGILFYGEPGVGKTLLAKALAKYVNCSFINLQPSDLQGTLYGETCKNVQAVFSLAAKYDPCIIFIDEMDSLFRKRTSNDHETTALLKTTFMSLWDGIASNSKKQKNIIILGATNKPEAIDPAILRRLPEKILVPLPNVASRLQILKTILKNESLGADVNLKRLAKSTENLTGSDLKEICRNAAINSIDFISNSIENLSDYNKLKKCKSSGAGDIKTRCSKHDNDIEPGKHLGKDFKSENVCVCVSKNSIQMIDFEKAFSEFLNSRVV